MSDLLVDVASAATGLEAFDVLDKALKKTAQSLEKRPLTEEEKTQLYPIMSALSVLDIGGMDFIKSDELRDTKKIIDETTNSGFNHDYLSNKIDKELSRRDFVDKNKLLMGLPALKGSYTNEEWNEKQINQAFKKRDKAIDTALSIDLFLNQNREQKLLESIKENSLDFEIDENLEYARENLEELKNFSIKIKRLASEKPEAVFWKDKTPSISSSALNIFKSLINL